MIPLWCVRQNSPIGRDRKIERGRGAWVGCSGAENFARGGPVRQKNHRTLAENGQVEASERPGYIGNVVICSSNKS